LVFDSWFYRYAVPTGLRGLCLVRMLEACKGTMLAFKNIIPIKNKYKTFPNLIKNLKSAILNLKFPQFPHNLLNKNLPGVIVYNCYIIIELYPVWWYNFIECCFVA